MADRHQQELRLRLHQGSARRARRFHHITYALDSREEILRAADIFLEAASRSRPDRTSTPSSRPSSSTCSSPAATGSRWRMPGSPVLAPDWKPIRWTEEERKKAGLGPQDHPDLPHHGTPPLPGHHGPDDDVQPDLAANGIAS